MDSNSTLIVSTTGLDNSLECQILTSAPSNAMISFSISYTMATANLSANFHDEAGNIARYREVDRLQRSSSVAFDGDLYSRRSFELILPLTALNRRNETYQQDFCSQRTVFG